LILAAGICVACTSTQKEQSTYREPGATPGTSETELDGRESGTDLNPLKAQTYVDYVRMGYGVDPEGKVPDDMRGDNFADADTVYVSMEVTDAPAGSNVQLSIYDKATNERVWSETRTVMAGRSHLNFAIDAAKLAKGNYRADVIIGDETVANREFEVDDTRA
jgi:hypothetical protein